MQHMQRERERERVTGGEVNKVDSSINAGESDDISLSGGDSLLNPSKGVAGEADPLIRVQTFEDPVGIVNNVVAGPPGKPREQEHQHQEYRE